MRSFSCRGEFRKFRYLFHDGGPYHLETSPLIYSDWFLYDRDFRHERV